MSENNDSKRPLITRQYELVEKLRSYDPNMDEDLLNRAYVFSMKAHGSQMRASGDPYFSHPLEVAGILCDLKLDHTSVIVGLLHDTVEDTLATVEEIEKLFGPEIARLVDGVTKISQLELQSEHTKQAENFGKLLLAMSSDIRVLLVKLADRLHNMMTLHFITSEEKRKRIARETMDIYVPLTERMGMQQLKDELEDLAFAHLNAEARESVQSRLNFLYENASYTIEAILSDLRTCLEAEGVNAVVSGRQKTPYSIWRKMQTKSLTFEQLSDIIAFRIVVDDVSSCYQALGVIHNKYLVLPGRFKDYISTPKPNGYKSLHTGLIGPFNSRIEIQIRTKEMHSIAELGIAAHWQYKQGNSPSGKQYAWLRSLLEILDHASSPEEFLEHTKLEMFHDQVFCFTPKGDLIPLPSGATPIDFAYAVHSQIGDHTVAAKINGRQMPLRTILSNGDQVEIVTSKTQSPSPTWERFIVTGKARSRIRKFIRTQHRQQFSELGKSIFLKTLRQERLEYQDKAVDLAVDFFKLSHIDDLFAGIGEGIYTAREVVNAGYPSLKAQEQSVEQPTDFVEKTIKKPQKEQKDSLSIKGLISGMALHYAGCCHPIPGDHIAGIVITGKGVTIHTLDCDVLTSFHEPDRILDLTWEDELNPLERFVCRLKITFTNKPGSLASVSTVISKQKGNIVNLKITNRTMDFWDIFVDIEVKNTEHLSGIIAGLRTLNVTNAVERI